MKKVLTVPSFILTHRLATTTLLFAVLFKLQQSSTSMPVGMYFPRSYLPYMMRPSFRPQATVQSDKIEKKSADNVEVMNYNRQPIWPNLAIHENGLESGKLLESKGKTLNYGSRLERLPSIKRNNNGDRPTALTMSGQNSPHKYENDDKTVKNHYQKYRHHYTANQHHNNNKDPDMDNLVKAFFSPTIPQNTRNDATFTPNVRNAKKSVNGFQRTGGMILLGKRQDDDESNGMAETERPLTEYRDDEFYPQS